MFCIDLTFEWYKMPWHSLCSFFFFRINVRKRNLDESGFRHCYGNFFESAILKVTWSQLYSKFFLNKCEVHGQQQYFKDTLNMNILRTWIKIRATSFIKIWVNIKRKLTKVPWKLSLAEKYDPALQRTLHQSRWYFAYCYMLLSLSYKPSFYV